MSSPLNDKDPFAFLTGDSGGSVMGPITEKQFDVASSGGASSGKGAKIAQGATAGLSAFGGMAGDIVGSFRGDDPTKSGYAANTAVSKGLEYASKGAALGPVGAGIGLLAGTAMGLVGASKDKKEYLAKQAEETRQGGMSTASDQLAKNLSSLTVKGKILKSIPYNPPKNMSALQYKSSLKMEQISGISERRTNEKKY
jgi:hypothetical protein